MTFHLDLFAGIGGFALSMEMTELEITQRFFSEINEYAIKIYQKNFPSAVALGNVRNVDASKLPIGEWIVTGGFPCQPFSIAGNQQGAKDERYLWGEITRIVSALKPTWCVFENVPQIENVAFSVSEFEVGSFKCQRNAETDSLYKLRSRQEILQLGVCCQDLRSLGYEVIVFEIPALAKNAPHRRMRTWIIANRPSVGHGRRNGQSNRNGQRQFSANKSKRRILRSEIEGRNFTHSDIDQTSAVNQISTGRTVNRGVSFDNSDTKSDGEHPKSDQREATTSFATSFESSPTDSYGSRNIEKREIFAKWANDDRDNSHKWLETATELCRVDDELSSGLDVARLRTDISRLYPDATEKDIEKAIKKLVSRYRKNRIEALGNAIVPSVAMEFFRVIKNIK